MNDAQFIRRPALAGGIAAAVLIVFAAAPAMADHGYAMNDHPLRGDFPTASSQESIERKAALKAPGATTLRLEQLTLEPGATVNSTTMGTAFVCEMVQGEVESVIDGVSVTRNNGDVWTCPIQNGDALHTNSGTKLAVMRVIHLIP